jgi:hypothetical protein
MARAPKVTVKLTDTTSDEDVIDSLVRDSRRKSDHDAKDEMASADATVEHELRPLTPEEIQSAVRVLIDEAVEFSESELSQDRITSQRYYNGETDLGVEDGRSSIVVSRVRDAVLHLMPSIMRIFLQGESVVEFKGTGPEDARMAEEITAYCNDVFWSHNDGYGMLYEAASDSLVKKVGPVKAWWDDTPRRVVKTIEDADELTIARMEDDPDWEITEEIDNGDGTIDIIVSRDVEQGKCRFSALPPEDFHVNRGARGPKDAFMMVHRENKRISELIEMGFTYEEVQDASYEDNSTTDAEDDYRRGYVSRNRDETEVTQDPVSREVLVTDSYIHIDADGDGVAELRHFITVGSYHRVLLDEPVNGFDFAVFYSEIEPHAFFPRCLADMNLQDQDSATSLMRGVLDNVSLSNSPQREVDEGAANVEDAMNSEIGAIIRSRRIGSVKDLAVPFIGGQTLPVMQYLDQVHESRSGVTKLSAGLDPDILQSTTPKAVDATVSSAQARAELISRNLAKTGMVDLFRLILRLTIENATGPIQVAVGEKFMEVDPTQWHQELNMRVNVGLGTGQIQEKVASLQGVAAKQEVIIEKMGPHNPYCGWENLRHTYVELLELVGYNDVTKFFPEPDPKKIQAWQEQQQQNQEKSPAEMQMETLMKVEQLKAQLKAEESKAKLNADMMKKKADISVDVATAMMEDDRKRDKDAMAGRCRGSSR